MSNTLTHMIPDLYRGLDCLKFLDPKDKKRIYKYLSDLLEGDTKKYQRKDYSDRLKAFIWQLEQRYGK